MKMAALIALLLGPAMAVHAQAPAPEPRQEAGQAVVVERQAKGRSGRVIRLLTITNVRADCTSGPLPTVRLATAPKNGRVVVRRVRYTATNRQQCLAAQVPALVALYRSTNDFEGTDIATLEIRFEGRQPQLRRYTIAVTKTDDGSSI